MSLFVAPAEQVVNNGEVMAALHEVGAKLGLAVRPYTVTATAPFASFVAAMSKTGLLVARHGPLLANAAFLPPGAAVLELLPYNWEWQVTAACAPPPPHTHTQAHTARTLPAPTPHPPCPHPTGHQRDLHQHDAQHG